MEYGVLRTVTDSLTTDNRPCYSVVLFWIHQSPVDMKRQKQNAKTKKKKARQYGVRSLRTQNASGKPGQIHRRYDHDPLHCSRPGQARRPLGFIPVAWDRHYHPLFVLFSLLFFDMPRSKFVPRGLLCIAHFPKRLFKIVVIARHEEKCLSCKNMSARKFTSQALYYWLPWRVKGIIKQCCGDFFTIVMDIYSVLS